MKLAFSVILFVGLAFAALAQPTKTWNQGNPTNDEQYALEVINRVRSNPIAAVDFYVALSAAKPALATMIAQHLGGAAGIRSRIAADVASYPSAADGRTAPPKGPLVLYPLFTEAAKSLPNPTSALFTDTTGGRAAVFPVVVLGDTAPALSGPNATGGTARTFAGGFNATGAFTFGANAFNAHYSGSATLREGFLASAGLPIAPWLDDAVTLTRVGFGGSGFTITRGKTRMAGIAMSAPYGSGSRSLNFFSSDNEAFASSDLPFGPGTVFITGVVYQDTDRDTDYTPGEGLGGVGVTPSSGEWLATTSTSGGYAIPVRAGSGTYTVTAKLPDGSEVSKAVTVGNDNVKLDFTVDTRTKPTQVNVPPGSGTTFFSNLSTRGVAAKGENALISGFVISGTGTKKVLVRGVANSLKAFGLTNVLRKPVLTLYNSKGEAVKTAKTQEMYDYNSGAVLPAIAAAATEVGAFQFARVVFDGGRFMGDVAISIELAPGAYTVAIAPDTDTPVYTLDQDGKQVSDEDPFDGFEPSKGTYASNGLVLLEVYDASPDSGSRFINLSSRGKIEVGDRQMIVGVTLRGSGTGRVLLRGVGPALGALGLSGSLTASALDLFDSQGRTLAANDGWGTATWTDQSSLLSREAGAFGLPLDSADSVILVTIPSGTYSAAVRSVSGAPGIGLAEIYDVR